MSLKQSVKKEIKSKFPKVYNHKNDTILDILSWIFSRGFWAVFFIYLALISIIVLYTIFINWDFLKFFTINFDDTVKTFTTGIITLVSMNLFVTNLLLTHLKDERDEIQSIIDKKVNFKFITYLGFTLIICVLSLYFVSPSIRNQSVKSNILIFIFSSFASYILLLVYLYNIVFNFIHKTKRTEIVKQELHLEFHKAFYNHYYKKRFKEEYQQLMENELKFKSYPFWQEIVGFKHHIKKNNKNVYLDDINISAIKALSQKIGDKEKYYHKLELGKLYEKTTDIKLFALTADANVEYKNIYSFSSKNNLQSEYDKEYLGKLIKKVNDNTLSNKFNELGNNLQNLDDIYTEFIELENEL